LTDVREPIDRRHARVQRDSVRDTIEPVGEPRSEETTRAIRRVSVAIAMAFAAILVFNSAGTRSWVRDLPGSPVADRLIVLADGWHAVMEGARLTAPAAFLRERMYDVRDVAWTDVFGDRSAIASGDEDLKEDDNASPVTAEDRFSETPRDS
jgi:hypothetical protein